MLSSKNVSVKLDGKKNEANMKLSRHLDAKHQVLYMQLNGKQVGLDCDLPQSSELHVG